MKLFGLVAVNLCSVYILFPVSNNIVFLFFLQIFISCTCVTSAVLSYLCKPVKGKAIPLQALTGPEGSRRLRLPDFETIGTWSWRGCQLYAPPAFTPRKYSWYSFLLEAESTTGPSAACRIMSMKNSNATIGNGFRDLPVCGAVPQPLRHRVPLLKSDYIQNCVRVSYY
jgi:hypothetical protein